MCYPFFPLSSYVDIDNYLLIQLDIFVLPKSIMSPMRDLKLRGTFHLLIRPVILKESNISALNGC